MSLVEEMVDVEVMEAMVVMVEPVAMEAEDITVPEDVLEDMEESKFNFI